MRFLVDAQLPPALVVLLQSSGHEAEHVLDIGPADASDSALWRHALAHDAAIVTKDEDFATRAAVTERSPSIVWVRTGNVRRAALLAWIEPLLPHVVAAIEAGDRVIELR